MHVLLGENSSQYAAVLKSQGKTCIAYLPPGAKAERYPEDTIVTRNFEDLVREVTENASKECEIMIAHCEGSKFHTSDEYLRITEGLKKVYQLKRRSDYTSRYWMPTWESNILVNLPKLAVCHPVDEVSFEGLPAIVVGPGPSLKKNIKILKKMQNKVLIIALQRAFQPLTKAGIRPNAVICLDPGDRPIEHFEDCPVEDIGALILEFSVSPEIYALPGNNKMVFAGHGGPLPQYYEFFERVCMFSSGATVASSGVVAAMCWRCNPIMTVGVDLAYTDKRYGDTEDPGQKKAPMELPSWDFKEMVKSEADMAGTHAWLSATATENTDFTFVNCSFGGAGIPGFKHIRLNTMRKKFTKRYDFDKTFRELPPKSNYYTRQCLLSDLPEDLELKLSRISDVWKD